MAQKTEGQSAFYRKYRPQKFADVLGQEHIVSVLEGAIKQENIAHAYLFAGSRGIGKTTIARIFAHEIGTSDNDLYEIDAASNRGIDDIRELREGVLALPFESKYKVYIIDEVHMLTKEAFNALLKTLEEPPAHALFILATTELEKLPETIISRCQSFTFRKSTLPVLKEMIMDIAKKEHLQLEPSAVELISLLAEGSFRDAHGILQKVAVISKDLSAGKAQAGKKISLEEVEQVTGAPSAKLINDTIEAIAENDLSKGLEALKKAVGQNADMKVFLKMMLEKMRAVLLLRYAPKLKKELEDEYGDTDFKFLEELAGEKGKAINSKTLVRLLEAYDEVGRAYVRELPIELAFIDLLGSAEKE